VAGEEHASSPDPGTAAWLSDSDGSPLGWFDVRKATAVDVGVAAESQATGIAACPTADGPMAPVIF